MYKIQAQQLPSTGLPTICCYFGDRAHRQPTPGWVRRLLWINARSYNWVVAH